MKVKQLRKLIYENIHCLKKYGVDHWHDYEVIVEKDKWVFMYLFIFFSIHEAILVALCDLYGAPHGTLTLSRRRILSEKWLLDTTEN